MVKLISSGPERMSAGNGGNNALESRRANAATIDESNAGDETPDIRRTRLIRAESIVTAKSTDMLGTAIHCFTGSALALAGLDRIESASYAGSTRAEGSLSSWRKPSTIICAYVTGSGRAASPLTSVVMNVDRSEST